MRKIDNFYVKFSIAIIITIIVLFAYVNYDKNNTVSTAEYVDKGKSIKFSIDSCSPFIKCLSEDINVKDWIYYNSSYDVYLSNSTQTIYIFKSVFYSNSTNYSDLMRSGGNYNVDVVDSSAKIKTLISLNSHEQYLINKKIDKLLEDLIVKEKFVADSSDKALKSSLHKKYFPNCK